MANPFYSVSAPSFSNSLSLTCYKDMIFFLIFVSPANFRSEYVVLLLMSLSQLGYNQATSKRTFFLVVQWIK